LIGHETPFKSLDSFYNSVTGKARQINGRMAPQSGRGQDHVTYFNFVTTIYTLGTAEILYIN